QQPALGAELEAGQLEDLTQQGTQLGAAGDRGDDLSQALPLAKHQVVLVEFLERRQIRQAFHPGQPSTLRGRPRAGSLQGPGTCSRSSGPGAAPGVPPLQNRPESTRLRAESHLYVRVWDRPNRQSTATSSE